MPSRKQRRRRAKERRHEYEVVYVDEEGREVEVDPAELRKEKEKPPARDGKKPDARSRRPPRPVKPPSWNRTLRRGIIFFPLFFFLFTTVQRHTGIAARLALSLLYTALFVPFMYLVDRTTYRAYLRRTGGSPDRPGRRR